MMCSVRLEGLNQNNEGIDGFNARITEAMHSTAVDDRERKWIRTTSHGSLVDR